MFCNAGTTTGNLLAKQQSTLAHGLGAFCALGWAQDLLSIGSWHAAHRRPVKRGKRNHGDGDVKCDVDASLGLDTESEELVLAMLSDIDDTESSVLSQLPYSENEVVLHTDTRLLPRKHLAWSSWNYRLRESNSQATLTYNMNILQGINSPETFCVTLNDTDAIDPRTILGEYRYAHPQFTIKGIAAQQRWRDINGPRNTWFCGAYWRNGFHEDGLFSGNRVADAILKKRGLQ